MKFFSCLLALFCGFYLNAEEKIETLAIGAAAPDFNLKGVDGKMHALADYKQDILAIVFTCNHCPTAQAYEPRLKALVNAYKDKSFQLIAISSADPLAVRLNELGWSVLDDSYEAMIERSNQMEFNFPYLYDGEHQKATNAYGPLTSPHIFIFDAERKLRYQGRIDNDERKEATKFEAKDAIDALLAGKAVEVQTTKAFGCSTKWSSKREAVKKNNEAWAAKPVTLEEIDNDSLKKLIKNDTDKVRIINLWSTMCAPCVLEIPELVKINRQFETRGVELITLNVDPLDKKEDVLKVLKSENVAITDRIQKTLKDEGRETNNYILKEQDRDIFIDIIDKKWEGPLPHTIVVLPGGEILFRHNGEIEPVELKKALIKHLGNTYK